MSQKLTLYLYTQDERGIIGKDYPPHPFVHSSPGKEDWDEICKVVEYWQGTGLLSQRRLHDRCCSKLTHG